MQTAELTYLPEYALDAETVRALGALLPACFPGFFAERIYHKQLPHGRFLARQGGTVVGQVGIDHRVVRAGDRPLTVLGVIDLCVAAAHRGRGLGGRLLQAVEDLGRTHGVGFTFLVADDPRLYLSAGYTPVRRRFVWLGIDAHRSVGQRQGEIDGTVLVKPLGEAPWPKGDVDLLGYLF